MVSVPMLWPPDTQPNGAALTMPLLYTGLLSKNMNQVPVGTGVSREPHWIPNDLEMSNPAFVRINHWSIPMSLEGLVYDCVPHPV